MMYLVFNELSFLEYKNSHELLSNFIAMGNLFNKAKELYGFTHLLFSENLSDLQVTQEQKFAEWLSNLNTKDKNKIFAITYRKPFLGDYLGDKKEETGKYFFTSSELNIEQVYCNGLATADMMEIPCVSLLHHKIWGNNKLEIFRETEESSNPESVFVYNVATNDGLLSDDFQQFCESISKVELLHSTLSYQEKKQKIHLRDDHGKDVLEKFAHRIINNQYVEGVINSLPFNSKTSLFISDRDIHKDGRIEITLHWEDAGYGMVLKTTGRNHRETEAIANILRNEYDR